MASFSGVPGAAVPGAFVPGDPAASSSGGADYGFFTEQQTILLSDSDSGVFSDASPFSNVIGVSSADTATGSMSESAKVSVGITSSDTFTGTEAQTLRVIAAPETGSLTDAQQLQSLVVDADYGTFAENQNFPGGAMPLPIMEGFSVTKLGVLVPGSQALEGTLYGVRTVQLTPQWTTTATKIDDWTALSWNAPGKVTLSVTGGFLPWDILALLYGTSISSSGAAPQDYYALPLYAQHNNSPFSLVAELSGKDSQGNLRSLLAVLYSAYFGPLSFTGPAYKNGLEVSYAAELVLSAVDETGQQLGDRSYGRLDPVPYGSGDWLPPGMPPVPVVAVRDSDFGIFSERVISAGPVFIPVSSSDSGTFTEQSVYAGPPTVPVSSADTGSFRETLQKVTSGTTVMVADDDAGSFTETNQQVTQSGGHPVSSADTVTGADAGSVTNTFQLIGLDGGNTLGVMDISPQATSTVLGGDVGGAWYTSNHGQSFLPGDDGLFQDTYRKFACIAVSLLETSTVYGCVGDTTPDVGAFVASTDGGKTYSIRSTAVQFAGNRTASPLPAGAWPRSTGRLLAQDPAHSPGYLYAATYAGGVARSADNGNTWAYIGFTTPAYYCRAICYDAANDVLYVALWGQQVWKCTNPRAATPSWAQLSGSPSHPEDLLVLGGVLYVASGGGSIGSNSAPSGFSDGGLWCGGSGGTSWTRLTGTFSDGTSLDYASSYWSSITGYIDTGGNHNVIAAASNAVVPSGSAANARAVVRAVCSSSGSGAVSSWHDLTAYSTISAAALPDGRTWWNAASTSPDWLGQPGFVNPFVLVDPTDTTGQTLWVTGQEGPFKTTNGGTSWALYSSGAPDVTAFWCGIDPNSPNILNLTDPDWTSWEITDALGAFPAQGAAATKQVSAPHQHGRMIAYDPGNSQRYLAAGDRFSATGGEVYTKTPSATSWTATGLNAAAGNAAVLGVYAGVDGSGNSFQLAATCGGGLWRKQGNGTSGTWSQVSSQMSSISIQPAGFNLLFAGAGALIWAFDRQKGIYRSADYGKTWTSSPIYPVTASVPGNGQIAANPAVANELWVSHDNGLFKLPDASTGDVPSGTIVPVNTKPPGSGVAGPLTFQENGVVYTATLPSASSPSAQLWLSNNSGVTWQAAANSYARSSEASRSLAVTRLASGQRRVFAALGGKAASYGSPPLPAGQRIGFSAFTSTYGGTNATLAQAADQADSWLRRPMARTVHAIYYKEEQYPAAGTGNDPQNAAALVAMGCRIMAVFKCSRRAVVTGGSTLAAQQSQLAAGLAYLQSIPGIDFYVVIGNEPNAFGLHGPFGNGSMKDWEKPDPYGTPTATQTATNFLNYYAAYVPTVVAAGLKVAYKPVVFSTTMGISMFPGAGSSSGGVDYITADWYAQDYLTNSEDLFGAGNIGGLAVSNNLPLGIGEWAVSGSGNPSVSNSFKTAYANTWIPHFVGGWTNMLNNNEAVWDIIYFGGDSQGGANAIAGPTDYKVPGCQALFDAVQGR